MLFDRYEVFDDKLNTNGTHRILAAVDLQSQQPVAIKLHVDQESFETEVRILHFLRSRVMQYLHILR